MKLLTFSIRNIKEILLDPLNLAFGLGFPIILLFMLSAIQANIPVEIFSIEILTPGIIVFGLSFMTLFTATLIAKDRESAFLQRLYTTPLTSFDYIFGYMLPIIPISIVQSALCYIIAMILGLPPTINILYAILFVLPISLFFIALGLLAGSLLNVKQVGGICGALLTNLCAFLSGAWFDINLIGGVFKDIAYCLPFVHAVELERAVLNQNYTNIFPHLMFVLIYALVFIIISIICFFKQMKK